MELAHLTLLTHQAPPFPDLSAVGSWFFPYLPYFFSGLFAEFSTASYLEILLNWLTIPLIVKCLLEGAWYAYFKWFKQPFFYFWYHFCTFTVIPHQSFSQDVKEPNRLVPRWLYRYTALIKYTSLDKQIT